MTSKNELSTPNIIWLETDGALRIGLMESKYKYIDFSPDGRWFLTYIGEKSYLWDMNSFDIKQEIEGRIWQRAFSGDGRHMAVYQPTGGQIQVVEVESGQVVNSFAASSLLTGKEPIGASGISIALLCFHPTKPELFIQIRPIYKYSEADDRYERMRQDATVYSVTHQAFGDKILSHTQGEFRGIGDRYKVISPPWGATQIVDTVRGKAIYRTKKYVKGVHFSQDQRYVLIITGYYSEVMNLPEGEVINHFDRPKSFLDLRKGFGLPQTVWIMDGEKKILIDGVTGQIVHRLEDFGPSKIRHVSISPDGRYLAGVENRQSLYVRNLQTDKVNIYSDERFGTKTELTFSPDGNLLFVKVE